MQRYEKYKDSGVDWIGEIPEGWEILPGLSFIYENKAKNKGMIRNTVLSLSYGKIRVKAESELTGLVPESFETYQLVNVGDLIFRPTDLQNDMVSLRSSISEYQGIITSAYLNLRFRENADPKFFHYFFRSIDNNKIIYGLGSGLRQNISYLDFRRFNFPFPPLPEQTAIAQFLDDKTAKIDQTICIKEKEIELLKERRQILIQKAVTKGLDDTVKLKDSGVDWIGEIPEHWEVRKLKFCLSSKLKYGANESGVDYDLELPRYVRITDFGFDGKLSEDKKLSLTWQQGKDYLLKDGDILFARSGATVGKSYQFKTSMSFEKHYSFAGYLIKAEANEEIIRSDYLYLYTNSNLFDNWKSAIFNKATIENIGADKYSTLSVVIPPLKEQEEILFEYNSKNEKIDKAILLKQQEIEKLKEYKTVLIDNVVTGKVKIN
ncbi:restriction endonuclease subunit S [Flavobacterium fluviatile]|uniref:restriction endonuclease subunit S n=1 Tax=Flavobacterium fluviatile TaxID=1862387 RepID=UPI0013D6C7A8|nr:restriction endonuclease subunit S [Flavobacterium fluviatile]